MKLIIAEKASLARNIVRAIGAHRFKSNDGYAESREYIVTWAHGHLFGLYDVEEYFPESSEESVAWTLDNLPFCPSEFKFRLRRKSGSKSADPSIRKQFNVIKKLCQRPDVDLIIHAGDADREGEIIIRLILDKVQNNKPVKRLWLPEQTNESIRASLSYLRTDSDYDRLANEGYARTYMDWLYGVNLTRLATIKGKSLLRVGRVIVPIVKAIYDRDMYIKNFVSEPYIALVSKEETKGHVITLTSKKTFSVEERKKAFELARLYNATPAIVSSVKTEKKEIKPQKLFSLSTAQALLGKKFKMTPKESLDTIQKLYEAGYLTYPRTNTQYLAKAEAGRVNLILKKLVEAGYPVEPKDKSKRIYDDSKIESHSALTPTGNFPKKEDLSEREWQVYSTIFNRFVAVFCSNPCTVDRTTVIIDVGELEQFKLIGDVFLSKGWMEFEETNRSDVILPPLKVGDKVVTKFQPVEKKTAPPKHYTVDTLGKFMLNPFRVEKLSLREEDTDESESAAEDDAQSAAEEDATYKAIFDGIELGTEATRTSIIDNAIRSQYISLKNNTYTILPHGIFYIETLQQLGLCLSKEKTAEMGQTLKKVYRGEISIQDSVNLTFTEVQALFNGTNAVQIDASVAGGQIDVVGKCPVCGSDIKENHKAFSCTNRDCSVVFFKDNKLLSSVGKRLTATTLKSLLSKGKANLKNCKSAKSGTTFDCILKMNIDDGEVNYEIDFPNPEDNAAGTCPKCGGMILPNRFGNYSCSNWQQGCKYTIFGTVAGKKLTRANVRDLLTKGQTAKIKGFTSKNGNKKFDAWLILDRDGKTSFMFDDRRRR